ncbi:MAG TPA: hypothetical protein VHF89_07750 [Solirubrobacteraceae bacterium]|nr:hypothetical protein [Solirubrobacteraceae bacterium]
MESSPSIYHHLLAWGSDDVTRPITIEEQASFMDVLQGHSFVELFPGVVILLLTYETEGVEVLRALHATAKSLHDRLSVVMSPAIPTTREGTYGGLLPHGRFAEVRKRLGQPPKVQS